MIQQVFFRCPYIAVQNHLQSFLDKVKENIDDIILMDSKFNIQGMSLKLMKILNISNKNLFQEKNIGTNVKY